MTSLEEELLDRVEIDTNVVVRVLDSLNAELHTLEGANAEVNGALVGVVIGAILSLAITLIANLNLITP